MPVPYPNNYPKLLCTSWMEKLDSKNGDQEADTVIRTVIGGLIPKTSANSEDLQLRLCLSFHLSSDVSILSVDIGIKTFPATNSAATPFIPSMKDVDQLKTLYTYQIQQSLQ